MTITEFLLARIGEDEAIARGADPGPWNHWPEAGWIEIYNGSEMGPDMVFNHVVAGQVRPVSGDYRRAYEGGDEYTADHICRHDPVRVLAESAAKRRIVKRVVEEWADFAPPMSLILGDDILQLLAMAYADHPDFDPACGTTQV